MIRITCKHCGEVHEFYIMPDGALYCKKCGKKLNTSTITKEGYDL